MPLSGSAVSMNFKRRGFCWNRMQWRLPAYVMKTVANPAPLTARAGRFIWRDMKFLWTVVAMLLTGCAAPVPLAGPQFDGHYSGQTSLTRGWGELCGVPDLPHELVVRNGSFLYPFQVNPPIVSYIEVPITVDGTFRRDVEYGYISPGWRTDYFTAWMTVLGRINGNTMEVTETDLRCDRHSMLQKQ